MATLLDDSISVPAVAYGAEPLSVAEIDAHPDGARIWSTIRAMRAAHETVCDNYETRLERAGDVS